MLNQIREILIYRSSVSVSTVQIWVWVSNIDNRQNTVFCSIAFNHNIIRISDTAKIISALVISRCIHAINDVFNCLDLFITNDRKYIVG